MNRRPGELDGHPMDYPPIMCYRAFVERVVSIDLVDLLVDLGLNQFTFITMKMPRLTKHDTPEMLRRLRSLIEHRPVSITTSREGNGTTYVVDISVFDNDHHTWSDAANTLLAGGDLITAPLDDAEEGLPGQ